MGANVSCACVVIFCDGIGTRDAHLNKLVTLTSVQEIDFDFRQNDIVLVLVLVVTVLYTVKFVGIIVIGLRYIHATITLL